MVKLTALYRKPPDPAKFDQYYKDVHTPLVLKIPGLRKIVISKVKPGITGDSPYYMMADMFYDDINALQTAISSPEGKATAKDVGNFAKDIIEIFVAEVEEKQLASVV
jgi:uncharacterized protein (TIGR02118 family)